MLGGNVGRRERERERVHHRYSKVKFHHEVRDDDERRSEERRK